MGGKKYGGPERRTYHEVPDELIDLIAERAAEKAATKAAELVFNKIYQDVGRSVLRKLAWAVGITVIALAVWINGGKIG